MRFESVQYLIDLFRGKKELIDPNKHINVYTFGDKFLYRGQDGSDIISKHLLSDEPEMICRFGTLELETVRQMLKYRNSKKHFNERHTKLFTDTAGFFPSDDYNLSRFACEQLDILKDVDVIACRSEKFEIEIVNKYLCNSDLIDINSISYPFCYNNPWSKCLKGKKVLVINPFDESIKAQYAKREFLFENPDVLPEFDLITFRPVQGIGRSKNNLKYKTWFEALDDMKSQIKDIDFDVAIIGAGAYGMFLAQYCKSLGKKAVHMGGSTQLLFGLSGKRWDNYLGKLVYNEYWARPSKAETPDGVELFEKGTFAYW